MSLEPKFDCKSVVVIGHSQGAAVAYLTLKSVGLGKAKLLITFGAGIVKLFQLENRELKWLIDMFMLLFVGVSGQATFFMVAERLGLYRLPPDKVPFVMWAAAAAALFWMVAGVVTASLEHTEEIRIQAS